MPELRVTALATTKSMMEGDKDLDRALRRMDPDFHYIRHKPFRLYSVPPFYAVSDSLQVL